MLLSQDVRAAKGKGNLDKTYMDTDDDDEEFDDADEEELEDLENNDISAFMCSKSNVTRYIDQSILQTKQKRDQSEVDYGKFRNNTDNEDFSGKVVVANVH